MSVFKVLLKDGIEIILPIRHDGFVNAKLLCKSSGKKFKHWYNLEQSKEIDTKLIDKKWVHPSVAINIAQWISPESVSKWLYSSLSQLENLKVENQKLLTKYNSSLKKHSYFKFKETGPCFYIIDSGLEYVDKLVRNKFGIAGTSKKGENVDNIDKRLQSHRTLWTRMKIHFLVFVKDAVLIENIMKTIYSKNINPNGHEIIEDVLTQDLINKVKDVLIFLNIEDYHIVNDEQLQQYNDNVVSTIKETPSVLKKRKISEIS